MRLKVNIPVRCVTEYFTPYMYTLGGSNDKGNIIIAECCTSRDMETQSGHHANNILAKGSGLLNVIWPAWYVHIT